MRLDQIGRLLPYHSNVDAAEVVLAPASLLLERVCRYAYRGYLRRRAATWSSPDQVVLGDDRLVEQTVISQAKYAPGA